MSAPVTNEKPQGSVSTQTSPLNLDPSRRPDVLLRRRKPNDYEVNPWWHIGSFLAISITVVGLMNFFPG